MVQDYDLSEKKDVIVGVWIIVGKIRGGEPDIGLNIGPTVGNCRQPSQDLLYRLLSRPQMKLI